MKNVITAFLKRTAVVLLILIVSVFTGTALLVLVCSLPNGKIEEHLEEAAMVLEEEGTGKSVSTFRNGQLDNWTDAVMLQECAVDTGDAFQNAMLSYMPIECCTAPISGLLNYVSNGQFGELISYGRYWHGYKVLLKPILSLMSYSRFRFINFCVLLITTAVVALLMIRRNMPALMVPYGLAVYLLFPYATSLSIQFSVCFYMMQFFTILYLLFQETIESRNWQAYVFLLLGILTAYNDLLTYPVVPFGILLGICLYSRKKTLLQDGFSILANGLMWGAGYAGMWAGKWVLATLTTDVDVIADAISQFKVRSADVYTLKDVVLSCFNYLTNQYILAFFIVVVITLLIVKIYKRNINARDFVVYLVIGLIPIAWYAFARQHSGMHVFFTHKDLVLSFYAVAMMCLPGANRNTAGKSAELQPAE